MEVESVDLTGEKGVGSREAHPVRLPAGCGIVSLRPLMQDGDQPLQSLCLCHICSTAQKRKMTFAALLRVVLTDSILFIHCSSSLTLFLDQRARKHALMPWLDGIGDVHARDVFADAWQAYPVKKGEVIFQHGQQPRFVAVVVHGEYQLEATVLDKKMLRPAAVGLIVGLFAARNQRPLPVTLEARTDGFLWVLDAADLRQHNSTSRQDIIALMEAQSYRQVMWLQDHKFPIVLFPGFMSSRLEAWKSKSCSAVNVQPMQQVRSRKMLTKVLSSYSLSSEDCR